MSDDEAAIFIVSGITAFIVWILWIVTTMSVSTMVSPPRHRKTLLLAPLASAAILYAVLRLLASSDVRESPLYITFYEVMGLAWVGLTASIFIPFLGVSARDDAIERRNPAASTAIVGAFVGFTLAFAGGNIGDGPGWWVVVVCALLSTGGLILSWIFFERFSKVSEAITVDRDRSAGVRLAGLLVANGLVLGRAVAGDYLSFENTFSDFIRGGWPVIGLTAIAAAVERALKPSPEHPTRPFSHGVFPWLAYVALAAGWLYVLGSPPDYYPTGGAPTLPVESSRGPGALDSVCRAGFPPW